MRRLYLVPIIHMSREVSHMAQEGDVILSEDILEEARLKPGCLVEMKVAGPNNGSWLVIHNRGPKTLTTL